MRFTELKKDPSEIGEVDGETVDANAIETALRSVGVALRDTTGEFRDLDEVFLDLSKVWNDLDKNQQRYIATLAAGSRQQSRFLALMSNYQRTQELVMAANNSAGASNKQFEKTLESLDAKLAKLSNAWDSFTMGLANSSVIKTGVDVLAALITALDRATQGFGDLTNSISKIGLAFIVFKTGRALLDKLATFTQDKFRAAGKAAAEGFKEGLEEGGKEAQQTIKDSADQATTESNKKGIQKVPGIGKVVTNMQEGFAAFGEASSAKKDFLYLNDQAQDTRKEATGLRQTAQTKKDSGAGKVAQSMNNLERVFTAKMNKITKGTVDAKKVWSQYADSIAKGGKEGEVAFALLQDELKQVASNTDNTSLQKFRGEMSNITDGVVDLKDAEELEAEAAKKEAEAAELDEQAQKRRGETSLKTYEGINSLAEGITNMGTVAIATGTSVSLLGQGLESLGLEGAADALSQVGAALTTVGTIATVVGALIKYAGQAAQAGWGPFILIALAIVAAITAIIVVANQLQKNSPENQLKRAREATEKATKAAEEAKEAYEGLSESLDNLEDYYDKIKNLTIGTKEWKDAVQEVNTKILELIDTYPELAQFVKNVDGVLTIDATDTEINLILSEYEKEAAYAQGLAYSKKIDEVNLEKEQISISDYVKSSKSSSEKLNDLYMDTLGSSFFNEYTDALPIVAEAMYQGWFQKGADGWETVSPEVLQDLGLYDLLPDFWDDKRKEDFFTDFVNALEADQEDLLKFGQALSTQTDRINANTQARAAEILTIADTSYFTKKEITTAANFSADSDFVSRFDKKYSKVVGDNLTEAAEDYYGVSVNRDSHGSGEEDDEFTMDGVTYTTDSLQNKLSMDAAAASIEKLPDAFNKIAGNLPKEAGEAFKKSYLSEEGGSLTRKEANSLLSITDEEWRAAWEALDKEQQALYGDYDDFVAKSLEPAKMAQAGFDLAEKTLSNHDFDYNFEDTKMTADAAKSYANNMEKVLLAGGDEAADKFNDAFADITANMNEDQYKIFTNQISSMDWSDFDSWEKLPGTLKQLDITLPKKQLEGFIETAKECGGAIENIDVTKLSESAQTLSKLANDIRTGSQDRAISDSTYKTIIEENADMASQFQQNLDGEYIYLGSSMDKLREAINENTLAQVEKEISRLQTNIDAAEILEATANNGNTWTYGGGALDITEYQEWAPAQQKQFLKWFLEDAEEKQLDVSQLGIEGLGNETLSKISTLTEDEVENYLSNLLPIYEDLNKNRENLISELVTVQSLNYQSKNGLFAISDTQMARSDVLKGNYRESDIASIKAAAASLQAQAIGAGVDDITLNEYAKAQESFINMLEGGETDVTKLTKAYDSVAAAEAKIMNTTNLLNRSNAFKTFAEEVGEVVDTLDSGSVTGAERIQKLQKAVEDFGIVVNENNADELQSKLRSIVTGGDEGYKAFTELAVESIRNSNIDKAFADKIIAGEELSVASNKEMVEKMSAGYEAFGQFMLDETGEFYKFVFTNQEEFDTMLNNSGQKIEKWVNEYGRLYNMTQEQNALNREQERAERRYQRATENSNSTTEEIESIVMKQLSLYQEEADQQLAAYAYANTQITKLKNDNAQFEELYSYNPLTGQILTDEDKTAARLQGNDALKAEFDAFIQELGEQSENMQDAKDSLDDILDAVEDYKSYGQDEYNELWSQVRDAIIENQQKEIDELQNTHDAIVDAQTQLMNKLQEQIDAEREARQRDKTEQELADQRTRLAYLMADTGGGHQTEIAQLQQSLAEAETNYSDQLVDDALQNLQKANDKAAEQRTEQINIANQQLEIFTESQASWNMAKDILDKSLADGGNGGFLFTPAGSLVSSVWGEGQSPFSKEDARVELERLSNIAGVWTGQENASGAAASIINGAATNIVNSIQQTIKDLYEKDLKDKEESAEKEKQIRIDDALKNVQDFVYANKITSDSDAKEKGLLGLLRLYQKQYEDISGNSVNGKAHFYTEPIPTQTEPIPTQTEPIPTWMKFLHGALLNASRFATGGLADFTGPAWLDGTKSAPELVLNAQDTANFIVLKDILSSVLTNVKSVPSPTTNNSTSGDNYFDIDISVDSVEGDYDVEQMAEKIKDLIYDDSIYRNVNTINNLR